MVMKMMKPSPNLIDKIKFTGAWHFSSAYSPPTSWTAWSIFPNLVSMMSLTNLMLSAHTAIVSWVLVLETGDKWRLISTDHTLIAPHFISEPTRGIGSQPPIIRTHSHTALAARMQKGKSRWLFVLILQIFSSGIGKTIVIEIRNQFKLFRKWLFYRTSHNRSSWIIIEFNQLLIIMSKAFSGIMAWVVTWWYELNTCR